MKKGAKGRFQEGAHPLSSPLHHSQEESEGMKTRRHLSTEFQNLVLLILCFIASLSFL